IAAESVTHVRLDSKGVAWVDATNMKVIELAVDKLAHHSTPEEMQKKYPHLTLAQIYPALANYHDQKEPFNGQIGNDLHEVRVLREAAGPPPKADQLRALKKREMQAMATCVGDLKRVLTNVKTRGTWGEIQLGALLDQMLSPQQYASNLAPKPDSAER